MKTLEVEATQTTQTRAPIVSTVEIIERESCARATKEEGMRQRTLRIDDDIFNLLEDLAVAKGIRMKSLLLWLVTSHPELNLIVHQQKGFCVLALVERWALRGAP